MAAKPTAKPTETIDQRDQREHREAVQRSVKRLKTIVSNWGEISHRSTDKFFAEKLAELGLPDRVAITEIVAIYERGTGGTDAAKITDQPDVERAKWAGLIEQAIATLVAVKADL